MGDEQRPGQPTAAQATVEEIPTYSDAWGQPISEERRAELQGYLDRWDDQTDHGRRI